MVRVRHRFETPSYPLIIIRIFLRIRIIINIIYILLYNYEKKDLVNLVFTAAWLQVVTLFKRFSPPTQVVKVLIGEFRVAYGISNFGERVIPGILLLGSTRNKDFSYSARPRQLEPQPRAWFNNPSRRGVFDISTVTTSTYALVEWEWFKPTSLLPIINCKIGWSVY